MEKLKQIKDMKIFKTKTSVGNEEDIFKTNLLSNLNE
jgi:hypothetical protein